MTDRAQLVADLVRVLVEDGPRSGQRLAQRVRARKADVLSELRAGSCFERVGGGRTSVWRVAGTEREPIQGYASPDPDQDVVVALATLEARLTAVEERLGLDHDTNMRAIPAEQVTVDEAIAATNGTGAP